MQSQRVIAGVFGVVAIVLLVWGSYSPSWLYAAGNDVRVGVGLIGAETCEQGKCVSMSYEAIGARDSFWKYIGYAGTGAVIGTGILCLLLIMTTIVGVSRTTAAPGRGVTLTLIVSILALVGGIVCAVGMKRGLGTAGYFDYGSAMYSYLTGAVAAIIASALLRASRGRARPAAPTAT